MLQEVKKASLKYTDVMRGSVVHPSSRDLILSVHRRLIDRLAGWMLVCFFSPDGAAGTGQGG